MTTPSASLWVAVVTAACAGIGQATARTLAGQAFTSSAREGPIKALANEIGRTTIVADVTSDV
jgi:NADP-dependent 3-hydroxy acid dehydrogenase YdfG